MRGNNKKISAETENHSGDLFSPVNRVYCVFLCIQVIDLGGEPITSREYFHLGRVTEFKYGAKLGTIFRKWNGEKLSYTKYAFCEHAVPVGHPLFPFAVL